MTGTIRALESLGIDGVLRGSEYVAPCPAHKQRTGHADSNPSWAFNVDKRVFNCFGCGWKGTLSDLLETLGAEWEEDYELDLDIADLLEDSYLEDIFPPTMSDAALEIFTDVPDEHLASRYITREGADVFGIRWDHRTDSWVLPIRRDDGRLLGWQVKGGRRFRNFPVGVRKSDALFGLHLWRGEDTTVLVESPLDAVRLHEVGRSEGFLPVASYGAAVSRKQAELLFRFDGVVSMMDADQAGRRAEACMYERFPTLEVVELPTGVKDPGEVHTGLERIYKDRYFYFEKEVLLP